MGYLITAPAEELKILEGVLTRLPDHADSAEVGN